MGGIGAKCFASYFLGMLFGDFLLGGSYIFFVGTPWIGSVKWVFGPWCSTGSWVVDYYFCCLLLFVWLFLFSCSCSVAPLFEWLSCFDNYENKKLLNHLQNCSR